MALSIYTIKSPKGLNTIQSDANMSDDYAPIFLNAIIGEYGAISKRPGYKAIGEPVPNSQPIKSLMLYKKSNGDEEILAAAGSVLYKFNSANGTWTSIKSGLNSSKFSYTLFQGKIVMANGYDMPFYYDGETVQNLSGTPPEWNTGNAPQNIFSYKNRLFAGPNISDPLTIWYSALSNMNDWTSANNAGYISLGGAIKKSRKITDINSWDKYLIVFFDDEICIIYWDTPSTSLIEKIISLGAIYGRTILFGNDLIFVDTLGVKSLNRSIQSGELNINALSEIVENLIQEQIKSNSDVVVSIYPFFRWLLLGWSSCITVYDYLHKAWYKFTGIDAKSFMTKGSDLYFGDSNGQMHKFDPYYYSDNGNAIDFVYRTPWLYLGKLSTKKRAKILKTLTGKYSAGKMIIKQIFDCLEQFNSEAQYEVTPKTNSLWRESFWRGALWRGVTEKEFTIPIMGRSSLLAFQFEHSDNYKPVSIILNEIIFTGGGIR